MNEIDTDYKLGAPTRTKSAASGMETALGNGPILRRAQKPLDLKDALIIDGVAHAYDLSPGNRRPECPESVYRGFAEFVGAASQSLETRDPRYARSLLEFTSRWKAEDLAHVFFVESDVDIAAHHSAALTMFWRAPDSARWDTSLAMKKMAPDRVILYAHVDAFDPDRGKVFEDMARCVEEGATAFKFYPAHGFMDEQKGRFRYVDMRYDDREAAYPFFEQAYKLGIRHLAFHKSLPFGAPLMDNLTPMDLNSAALDFPDCTFEVVHDGGTFLEESAWQLCLFPNVYANLESIMNMIHRQPRRFAYILGTLLGIGGIHKVLFATGCGLSHPQPMLETFAAMEFEDSMLEMGFPQLTDEVKRAVLGENYARMWNMDVNAVKAKLKGDEWSKRRAEWNGIPWEWNKRTGNDPNYPYRGFAESTLKTW